MTQVLKSSRTRTKVLNNCDDLKLKIIKPILNPFIFLLAAIIQIKTHNAMRIHLVVRNSHRLFAQNKARDFFFWEHLIYDLQEVDWD